ncbi:kinesin-like nuclear fusion protein [Mortierella sp. GBA35]|nr:kinesin-like nuclear fusion protein [Mortierella sp. GBA35]
MEPLNRSISKLRPPTKVTATATTSSTIATALAVAAAIGGNENTAMTNNSTNITPVPTTTTSGSKRKFADTESLKPTSAVPASNAQPTKSQTNPARAGRMTTGNVGNRGIIGPTKSSAATRTPLSQAGRRGSPATSSNPSKSTNNPVRRSTAPVSARARPNATTTSTRTTQQLSSRATTQQPSPATSASSNTSSSIAPATNASVPVIPMKKKRPAWDTKGRLQDMEELTALLQEQILAQNSNMEDLAPELESGARKIAELQSNIRNLEREKATLDAETTASSQKVEQALRDKEALERRSEEELLVMKQRHLIRMEQERMKTVQMQQDIERVKEELRSRKSELERQMQENDGLRSVAASQLSSYHGLEAENSTLKAGLQKSEGTLEQRVSTHEKLGRQLAASQASEKDLEERLRQEETLRRQQHNTMQELKGNIRVFCRVRPVGSPVTSSANETLMADIAYPGLEGKDIVLTQVTGTATGTQVETPYPFTFDKVFLPRSTQEEVFHEISQLVQSALDGYNVCIFAYGQTGSGKTHTMEGPLNASAESMGMIPRSVLQIFERVSILELKGWIYTMEGQYIEIYNESINDLLGSNGPNGGKKHEIRHGPNGRTTITDITTVKLTSPAMVSALLKKAADNRSVGSTQMNERSSRSHSVFTLRLTGKNWITGESSEGTLNLIDLAGSERLSQSGATGDRLRETQAINRSLSSLGDVISSIANSDSHVPFRNSKLTYLLQNSLGGDSKALMFVNISPLKTNFGETLCSLRFAAKTNACHIGTASN